MEAGDPKPVKLECWKNPTNGRWYLRQPGVKGVYSFGTKQLLQCSLADDEEAVVIEPPTGGGE